MFVNDCIIFAKTSQKACFNINKILHNFCALSDFHKSSVQFLNNIQGAMKKRLGKALNISMSNGISKYRGSPIIQGRIKRSIFSEVILKSQKSQLHGKSASF